MNLAVIEVTGKQYLVKEGDVIETDRLPAAPGQPVTLDKVLLLWDGSDLKLGRPYLEGYTAQGAVLSSARGPKVIAYKYKRRKDYHRKVGHRQDVFKLEVKAILLPGQSAPEEVKKAEAKPPRAAAKKAAEKKPAAKKAHRAEK